jgi:hypothetical protein
MRRASRRASTSASVDDVNEKAEIGQIWEHARFGRAHRVRVVRVEDKYAHIVGANPATFDPCLLRGPYMTCVNGVPVDEWSIVG